MVGLPTINSRCVVITIEDTMEAKKICKLRYISPTSMKAWEDDRTEFYLRYLSEKSPPRQPQTLPMAIGSGFDARIKAYLYAELVGKGDPKFELSTLFNSQVAVEHQDQIWKDSEVCFEAYKSSGALADLVLELGGSLTDPRFETDLEAQVTAVVEGGMASVPFLGKPDVHFLNNMGMRVVLDFKVNGFYSGSGGQTKPGFVKRWPQGDSHKKCVVREVGGIRVNNGLNLDEVDADWARQLCVYGWLAGAEVGGPFVPVIHQLVWKPCGLSESQTGRRLEVAKHACLLTPKYQWDLFGKAVKMWTAIQNDWIWDDLPLEASRGRGRALDKTGDQYEYTPRRG